MTTRLFDSWPERYNRWFETPIGTLVKEYEQALILEMLQPQPGEFVLDAGCGTGLFTLPVLAHGTAVVGLDLSVAMLQHARHALPAARFSPLAADMLALPFGDAQFDRVVSITALEFVADGRRAIDELFRVTRPGGYVLVATLNSLSPWAQRRGDDAQGNALSVFRQATFRSPDELAALAPVAGTIRTAIHFSKDTDPSAARSIERKGQQVDLGSGAFLVGGWWKP